jgi:hypothetical protein
MQVGFKTGPRTWDEGKRIVTEDGARLCELWFRIDQASDYDDMLAWLQKHEVHTGLHHWGLAAKKYKTNLATKNEEIRLETMQQVRDTIDVCADIKGAYVNVHPGAAQVEELNLNDGTQKPVAGEQTDFEESGALFLSAAEELQAYATEKKVVLTLETLPGREKYNQDDRSRLYDPQSVPLAVLGKLGAQGNWLANDITHTLASLSVWESDDAARWELFMQFTRQAAPFTRLLHMNTLMPPHDGSDSHDGVTEEDFSRGVVPTKAQIKEALSLFSDRDDVFLIPEPHRNMQSNFRALQALVESI